MPHGTDDGADDDSGRLLRLATWNVNSIRTRLDRVVDWLARADVDVLAMQETKCADHQFPTLPFVELGYEVAHTGVNQWNGVAIASRVGLDDVRVGFDGQPGWSAKPGVDPAPEARALGATCAGVRVWSLYVPNGRAVGDPHYVYKLDWLAALRAAAAGWLRDDPAARIALVGDWNIAPTDDDVWSPEFFAGATHVSEPERRAFQAVLDAQFTDVVRPFTPGPGVYTYWDYTQLRFPKRQGMRIDFILASPALAGRVSAAQIVREERKGKGPSDHAPVLVDVRDHWGRDRTEIAARPLVVMRRPVARGGFCLKRWWENFVPLFTFRSTGIQATSTGRREDDQKSGATMSVVGGAARSVGNTVNRAADAATAAAGAVGGAAVNGIVGGVTGAAEGIKRGVSSGSHSTPAAALAIGALGVAGLVEWPVLLAVGGGALLLHRMHRKPEPPPKTNLTPVPGDASPKKAVPQNAAKPAAKKTAGRRAGASELRSTN